MSNTIRFYTVSTLLSLSLFLPALAQSSLNTSSTEQYLTFAFGNSNTKQDTSTMSVLTPQEMAETQGNYFYSRFLFTTFRKNNQFYRNLSFPFNQQPNDAFIKPRLKPAAHRTPGGIRSPFFPSRIPVPYWLRHGRH